MAKKFLSVLIALAPFSALASACAGSQSESQKIIETVLLRLSLIAIPISFTSFVVIFIALFLKKYKGNKKLVNYCVASLAILMLSIILFFAIKTYASLLCVSNSTF